MVSFSLSLALSGQHVAQVIGRAAAGGAVRLIDDGEAAVAQALLAEDGLLRIGKGCRVQTMIGTRRAWPWQLLALRQARLLAVNGATTPAVLDLLDGILQLLV